MAYDIRKFLLITQSLGKRGNK